MLAESCLTYHRGAEPHIHVDLLKVTPRDGMERSKIKGLGYELMKKMFQSLVNHCDPPPTTLVTLDASPLEAARGSGTARPYVPPAALRNAFPYFEPYPNLSRRLVRDGILSNTGEVLDDVLGTKYIRRTMMMPQLMGYYRRTYGFEAYRPDHGIGVTPMRSNLGIVASKLELKGPQPPSQR